MSPRRFLLTSCSMRVRPPSTSTAASKFLPLLGSDLIWIEPQRLVVPEDHASEQNAPRPSGFFVEHAVLQAAGPRDHPRRWTWRLSKLPRGPASDAVRKVSRVRLLNRVPVSSRIRQCDSLDAMPCLPCHLYASVIHGTWADPTSYLAKHAAR